MVGTGMGGATGGGGTGEPTVVIHRRSRSEGQSEGRSGRQLYSTNGRASSGGGLIRRWILRSALFGAACVVAQLYFPNEVDEISWSIRKWIGQTVYHVDVKFTGLSRLRSEDLEVLLPTEKPFWWWIVSAPTVEKDLVGQPLVKSVNIVRCSWYSLKCFEISVTERKPAALVSLQTGWWLVGDDGGAIGPVSDEGRANSELPAVLGGERFETTPQVLRERVMTVLDLLAALGSGAPKSIRFSSDSEVLLDYGANLPEVLLELGMPAWISEQLTRLAEVRAQLGERFNEVKRIDLAFQSQAVVTFREPVDSDPGTSKTAHISNQIIKPKSAASTSHRRTPTR